MSRFTVPFVLQTLIFLIPLNIYIIGDWMGSGIQTLFFRYNQTNIGNSLIFLNREIAFVVNGILTGKSAVASFFWVVGVFFICIAMLTVIYAYLKEEQPFVRFTSYINTCGALLFTISTVIQYGITFHGPAGMAIPFGIPVIFGVAYFQYRSSMKELIIDRDDSKDDPVDVQ